MSAVLYKFLSEERSESWYTRGGLWSQAAFLIVALAYIWLGHVGAGDAIAGLGFLAVLMTIQSKPTQAERSIWVLIAFVLLRAEIYVSHLDKTNQEMQQGLDAARQTARFESTSRSLSDTATNLHTSIGQLQALLATSQRTAALTEENLNSLTGGDSFAFVYPDANIASRLFGLKIHNQGRYSLNVARVTIDWIPTGGFRPGHESREVEAMEPFYVGPVAPHEGRNLRTPPIDPVFRKEGYAVYRVWVNAQNRGVSELILVKPSNVGSGLAFKILVWRAADKRRLSDFNTGLEWIRCLRETNWVEPNSNPALETFQPWNEAKIDSTPCSIETFFERVPSD